MAIEYGRRATDVSVRWVTALMGAIAITLVAVLTPPATIAQPATDEMSYRIGESERRILSLEPVQAQLSALTVRVENLERVGYAIMVMVGGHLALQGLQLTGDRRKR